jgi:hypothetical protein
MTEIRRLRRAIRDLHGLDGTHLESVHVKEEYGGQTVWDGTVEVFSVQHPEADVAYAFTFRSRKGGRVYAAVLGAGPVKSPRDAIRAYVLSVIEDAGKARP